MPTISKDGAVGGMSFHCTQQCVEILWVIFEIGILDDDRVMTVFRDACGMSETSLKCCAFAAIHLMAQECQRFFAMVGNGGSCALCGDIGSIINQDDVRRPRMLERDGEDAIDALAQCLRFVEDWHDHKESRHATMCTSTAVLRCGDQLRVGGRLEPIGCECSGLSVWKLHRSYWVSTSLRGQEVHARSMSSVNGVMKRWMIGVMSMVRAMIAMELAA